MEVIERYKKMAETINKTLVELNELMESDDFRKAAKWNMGRIGRKDYNYLSHDIQDFIQDLETDWYTPEKFVPQRLY